MIRINKYRSSYRDEVFKLVYEIRVQEMGWKGSLKDLHSIREIYQIKKGNFWVAVNDDKKVIGTIALEDIRRKRGYLKRIYMKKEYRGIGVGKKMLNKVLTHCKKEGIATVYLVTQKDAIGAQTFYEKAGFHAIDQFPKDIKVFKNRCYFKKTLHLKQPVTNNLDKKVISVQ